MRGGTSCGSLGGRHQLQVWGRRWEEADGRLGDPLPAWADSTCPPSLPHPLKPTGPGWAWSWYSPHGQDTAVSAPALARAQVPLDAHPSHKPCVCCLLSSECKSCYQATLRQDLPQPWIAVRKCGRQKLAPPSTSPPWGRVPWGPWQP